MNTYISSSFNTENFSNTKSSFSNSLKLELGENPGLELRSILIDTRAVIHEFYKEPIVVVCSKIPKIYNSNNVLYTLENKKEYELAFRSNPTFSFKKFKSGKLEQKESILIKQTSFAKISDFTDLVNRKLTLLKFCVKLGFNTDEKKFFFETDREWGTLDSIELLLSAPFSKDLGFTDREKGERIILDGGVGMKRQADFNPRKRTVFYSLLHLNNCELASIQDVYMLLLKVFTDVFGVLVDLVEISGVHFFKWGVIEDGIEIFLASVFLNSFASGNRYVQTIRKFDYLKLFSEYEALNSYDIIPVKKLLSPKLIKVFCDQLSYSAALTTSSLGLLGLIPYKEDEFLKCEIVSPVNQALYSSKIDKLTFALTDENKQILKLSTGAPTFLHCTLNTTSSKMYKLCHFDSSDFQSKKHFPLNTTSSFTQNLLVPIDSRSDDYYACLESIYVPSCFYNIFSAYTDFRIVTQLSSIELAVPDGFYTQDSFLETMNKIGNDFGFVLSIDNSKVTIVNNSDNSFKISFNPQLSYMLGYSSLINEGYNYLEVFAKKKETFVYKFKLSSLATRMIKVKTNFVEDSLMGNSHQPIFRIVNLSHPANNHNEKESGELISFSSKHWVKIRPDIYNTISLTLSDENDIPLTFSSNSESVEGVFIIEQRKYMNNEYLQC